ncbi:MAG: hypothetical protein SWJ54_10040 [Cyanobacteriota bacterium]|nr:hypothetical protein [Cyanobacteriota bacterium]
MSSFELRTKQSLNTFDNSQHFIGGITTLLEQNIPFSIGVDKQETDCLKEIAKILNQKGKKVKFETSDPLTLEFFKEILKDAYKLGGFGAALAGSLGWMLNASQVGAEAGAVASEVAIPADFLVPGSREFIALGFGIGFGAGAMFGIGKKVLNLKLQFKILENGEEGISMEFCFA